MSSTCWGNLRWMEAVRALCVCVCVQVCVCVCVCYAEVKWCGSGFSGSSLPTRVMSFSSLPVYHMGHTHTHTHTHTHRCRSYSTYEVTNSRKLPRHQLNICLTAWIMKERIWPNHPWVLSLWQQKPPCTPSYTPNEAYPGFTSWWHHEDRAVSQETLLIVTNPGSKNNVLLFKPKRHHHLRASCVTERRSDSPSDKKKRGYESAQQQHIVRGRGLRCHISACSTACC